MIGKAVQIPLIRGGALQESTLTVGERPEGGTEVSAGGFGDIAEKLRRSTVQVSAGRRGQGSRNYRKSGRHHRHKCARRRAGPLRCAVVGRDALRADLLLSDAGRDLAILQIARSSFAGRRTRGLGSLASRRTFDRRRQPFRIYPSADDRSDSRNWPSTRTRAVPMDTG